MAFAARRRGGHFGAFAALASDAAFASLSAGAAFAALASLSARRSGDDRDVR